VRSDRTAKGPLRRYPVVGSSDLKDRNPPTRTTRRMHSEPQRELKRVDG
jgi:hypothetical protein